MTSSLVVIECSTHYRTCKCLEHVEHISLGSNGKSQEMVVGGRGRAQLAPMTSCIMRLPEHTERTYGDYIQVADDTEELLKDMRKHFIGRRRPLRRHLLPCPASSSSLASPRPHRS